MRKIGGLIAVVLMALLVIIGCDNSTVTNDDNGEWINHINNIIANSGSGIEVDQSWYDAAATDPQTYTLSNENELLGLMVLVNQGTESFEGDTIELVDGTTYDLSSISSVMKGTSSLIGLGDREGNAYAFSGTFNGNDAVITGVDLSFKTANTVGTEDYTAVGFFGVVKGTDASNKAKIMDLVFEDCVIDSTSNTTGVAVGYAENAEISGIEVRNCTVIGPQGVGAVAGRLYNGGSIKNCIVENTSVAATEDKVDYSGSNYNAGGIVGCASGSGSTIEISGNSVDLGSGKTISATDMYAGGICGYAASIVTFSDNHVTIADAAQIDGGAGAEAPICAGGAGQYGSTVNTITVGSQNKNVTDKSSDTFTF